MILIILELLNGHLFLMTFNNFIFIEKSVQLLLASDSVARHEHSRYRHYSKFQFHTVRITNFVKKLAQPIKIESLDSSDHARLADRA